MLHGTENVKSLFSIGLVCIGLQVLGLQLAWREGLDSDLQRDWTPPHKAPDEQKALRVHVNTAPERLSPVYPLTGSQCRKRSEKASWHAPWNTLLPIRTI